MLWRPKSNRQDMNIRAGRIGRRIIYVAVIAWVATIVLMALGHQNAGILAAVLFMLFWVLLFSLIMLPVILILFNRMGLFKAPTERFFEWLVKERT